MRPFLITSICGGGIVFISYIGWVRTVLYSMGLPSILESVRATLFIVIFFSFIHDALTLAA